MFKPKNEYKTSTGLTVYYLGADTACPTCGCVVSHTPKVIELPEDPQIFKGYFDKMLRQMAENYRRVETINKRAAALRQLTDEVDLQINNQKILEYRITNG